MVTFKELSWPLKLAVVGGWIVIIQLAFIFIIGFTVGILGGG